MEIEVSSRTRTILNVMHVLSWIVFCGLCIKTGALLYSFFVSLSNKPMGAKDVYLGLNLSGLLEYSVLHHAIVFLFVVFLSGLKAYIFYLLIKIFMKINLVHPFSEEVSLLISSLSYCALGVGVISIVANGYCDRLTEEGVVLPNLQEYLGAGGEFLMLAGIIFIIAQVFKRGIEIQSDNELTV